MTLSLAACGSNSTQTGNTQPEQTEQTEEAPASSDESASEESAAENTEAETPADETETAQASEPAEKVDINLAALSGPTALGMLDLLEKNDNGEAANNYNVTIATAPDEVTGKIISGELDIAAVPTNVASTLYNKTEGQVQIAALNTMGVLYVLETGDTIQSVADLAGKTIYATGQGSTPEYALNLVLEKKRPDPGRGRRDRLCCRQRRDCAAAGFRRGAGRAAASAVCHPRCSPRMKMSASPSTSPRSGTRRSTAKAA